MKFMEIISAASMATDLTMIYYSLEFYQNCDFFRDPFPKALVQRGSYMTFLNQDARQRSPNLRALHKKQQ